MKMEKDMTIRKKEDKSKEAENTMEIKNIKRRKEGNNRNVERR
jgi:hypothetical protein